MLPKGTDTQQVALWLEEMAIYKKLNVIRTCLVSSRTREGLPEAAAAMRRERLGRDVYVVGAANVGKSAFVRCGQGCGQDKSTRVSRGKCDLCGSGSWLRVVTSRL